MHSKGMTAATADRQAEMAGLVRAHQAGVWRYEADGRRQAHPGARFATGLRHALALAVHPETGALFAAVNGREALEYLERSLPDVIVTDLRSIAAKIIPLGRSHHERREAPAA